MLDKGRACMYGNPMRRPRQRRISIAAGHKAFDQNIAITALMHLPGIWMKCCLRRQHGFMRLPADWKRRFVKTVNHFRFTNNRGNSITAV